MSTWQPYREPLRTTLVRTGAIALVVGAVTVQWWGGMGSLPVAILLALWPALGGHWVEVGFLNGLRPLLPAGRGVQTMTRVVVWFVGGALLAMGMGFTAGVVGLPARGLGWWSGGLGFIGIELVAHLALLGRGRPSFYDGRG